MGGEGISLKERKSIYRPGVRSPAWLKAKPKLVLDVTIPAGPLSGSRGVIRARLSSSR
jgi:ATP-dependent DNA ligase